MVAVEAELSENPIHFIEALTAKYVGKRVLRIVRFKVDNEDVCGRIELSFLYKNCLQTIVLPAALLETHCVP
jgi:hypothetical protein